MNKNHEGYHDPTACEAIKCASRKPRRKKTRSDKSKPLMYRICEAHGFAEAIKSM